MSDTKWHGENGTLEIILDERKLLINRVRGQELLQIPIENILWCDHESNVATVDYASLSSGDLIPRKQSIHLDQECQADEFAGKVMHNAYKGCKQSRRFKVLVNPKSGRGKGENIFKRVVQPLLVAARESMDICYTTHVGHAQAIAREIDVNQFEAICTVSGDGTPHEVFNGLYEHHEKEKALKLPVCQIPAGSGNAMCISLFGSDAPGLVTLALIKGLELPLDLCMITQGDEQRISFLTTCYGLLADCDLGTEHLRTIFGKWRFLIGFLVRLIKNERYPCAITLEAMPWNKRDIAEASSNAHGPPAIGAQEMADRKVEHLTMDLPRLQNFYAGNMSFIEKGNCFFPAALPNDGFLDVILFKDVSRLQALKCMSVVAKGRHFHADYVSYYKVRGFSINPLVDSDLSVDGERLRPLPTVCKVLPGLGRTLGKSTAVFENTHVPQQHD